VPRPIDPEKYASKRSAIVSAASTQFATHGYHRSTTAGICREAGISSGTFFHYFPSKLDVLVAVLESGCDDLRARLTRTEESSSGFDAVLRYAEELQAEVSDDSFAVFVAGIAGLESEPRVAAALATEAELVADFLLRNVDQGQRSGELRTDVPAPDLARWVSWLLDGASQAAAVESSALGSPLRDAVRALLDAPS
jgi:AcrR family transcriptional regulator